MKFCVEIKKIDKDDFAIYINQSGEHFKTFSELEIYIKAIQNSFNSSCDSAISTFMANLCDERKGVLEK